MASATLRRAQQLFALEDIYLREANAFADPEFEPSIGFSSLSVQFKINPNPNAEQFWLPMEGGQTNHLRYSIETGLRVLKPGVTAEPGLDSPARDQIFAEITATFVVKYLVKQEDPPEQELVQAFVDNAVHHLWPYWREFIHATTSRMRIPAVVLPMRTISVTDESEKQSSIDEHASSIR